MVSTGSVLSGTFGFMRTNVRSIAIWGALIFVVSLGSMIGMRPVYAAQFAALQSGVIPAPQVGAIGLVVVTAMLIFIVLWAAVFRAVLLPADDRLAYLRVGMDEVRLLGTMLAVGLGSYVAFLVLGIVIGIVSAMIGAAAGTGVGVVTGIVFGLLLCGAAIWAAVRISPCGPLTILQRKVVIGPAWRLTRGRFWPLFGAYVAIGLLLFGVYAIVLIVQMGPVLGDMLHPEDPAAAIRISQWQVEHYGTGFSPRLLISGLVAAFIGGFALALQAGTTAVATRELLDAGGGIAETPPTRLE